MYGFSCNVYLVGKHAEYSGVLELPAAPDKQGIRFMLEQVAKEVNAFLEMEAQPGLYEVGVYVELCQIHPMEITLSSFWQFMGEVNKSRTMTWKRSDSFALTPGEVQANG